MSCADKQDKYIRASRHIAEARRVLCSDCTPALKDALDRAALLLPQTEQRQIDHAALKALLARLLAESKTVDDAIRAYKAEARRLPRQ